MVPVGTIVVLGGMAWATRLIFKRIKKMEDKIKNGDLEAQNQVSQQQNPQVMSGLAAMGRALNPFN